MANGKPFKIGAQPARTNPGDQVDRKPQNPAKTAAKAAGKGIDLVQAAAGEMAPDFDVSDTTPEVGSADGERPVYTPSNPWPPATQTAKPYKLK